MAASRASKLFGCLLFNQAMAYGVLVVTLFDRASRWQFFPRSSGPDEPGCSVLES